MSALLSTYPPYPDALVRGEGATVLTVDGARLLDFYGGHCVASTGHCHPHVVEAIRAQAGDMLFYSAAASLPIREVAASRLVDFAGGDITSVFLCNSGAEANENALKLAAQLTGRSRFVAFTGGFHGRSLLAMSCSDLPTLKAAIKPLLASCTLLPLNDAEALAAADFHDVAAVIVEPIQSMAGVQVAEAPWLAALREKCDASGTVLIFDEVQTGFGRVGAPFAFRSLGVQPDLVTCAKGIASGFPAAAVLFTPAIAERVGPGDLGSTFGGGPLACAAIIATLDVIEGEDLPARALAAEARIRAGLKGTVVTEIRGRGLLLGLVVGTRAAALKSALYGAGILVGASGDPAVLRLMPPLNVDDASIDQLIAAIRAFA